MDGVMEIITGRERRRRWSVEDKLRIVAELDEAGARVCDVAARHGVCESLVFTWRRQVREGILVAPDLPVFMPVQMLEQPVPAAAVPPRSGRQAAAPVSRSQAGLIEIDLGNGSQIRVGNDVNLTALRRVVTVLRG
jgi:transposase